jgi:hypothetical protein
MKRLAQCIDYSGSATKAVYASDAKHHHYDRYRWNSR